MGLSYIGLYLCGMRSLHSLPYNHFLKRLYKARENAGLTQIEVAQRFGKPQSFVSKCEQGERTVDVIDLLKFSKIYHVSLDFFFQDISIDDEPIQPIS
jgi:transcriptional regulator with XRE-family HTH domain